MENRRAAAYSASQFPAGKSSLRRLHILNWALRSAKNRAEFEQVRDHQQPLFSFQFRFEPALGRAINLAVGENYVDWVGGDRLQITAKGKRWVTEILKDETVMQEERDFLTRIGKDITETIATEMITVRAYLMLRIRHLFININTDKGVFGTRQNFADGLNIIRAEN